MNVKKNYFIVSSILLLTLLFISIFLFKSRTTIPERNPTLSQVNFFDSMNNQKMMFGIWSQHDPERYRFLAYLFEKNHPKKITIQKTPLIPKKLHQIWLGSEPPEYVKEFGKTWQKLHPDWDYNLWRDNDLEYLQLHNQKLFNVVQNYGQKADILRYHILYEIGGLYVDTDFKCLQSFDFLHHCYDFYAGISNVGDVELANGLIGAAPKHPIIYQCIQELKKLEKETEIKSTFNDITLQTGPGFFTNCFMKKAGSYKKPIIALPCSIIYPLPATHRKLPMHFADRFIKKESLAIHYWNCSWMKLEAFTPEKRMQIIQNIRNKQKNT